MSTQNQKKWSIYRCLIIYSWSAGNVSNVFTGGTVVKNPPVDAGETGDVGSIPRLGRILGERNSNPLQYSCLENWMDTGAWWATAHGVTKNRTWLSMHTLPKCIKDLTSTLSVVLSVPVTEVAIQELLSFSLFFFFFYRKYFPAHSSRYFINQFTLVHKTYLLPTISIVYLKIQCKWHNQLF